MKKFLAFFLGLLFCVPSLAQQDDRVALVAFNRSTATPTVAEVYTVQCVADVAGSLAGKYFTFYTAADAVKYVAWYKVSGSGTAPVVSGATLVEVDITTGDTADNVASATNTAVDALAGVSSTVLTDTVTITNDAKGAATNVAANTSGFTVGVSTAGVSSSDAIASASVLGDVVTWKICNDAVNTSTYLLVGKATDTETDGTSLDKGQCLTCVNCRGDMLRALKVSAQAASNGYAVVQYRK